MFPSTLTSLLSTLTTAGTASKYSGLLISLVVTVLVLRRRWKPKRYSALPKHQERVVILGATRFDKALSS